MSGNIIDLVSIPQIILFIELVSIFSSFVCILEACSDIPLIVRLLFLWRFFETLLLIFLYQIIICNG